MSTRPLMVGPLLHLRTLAPFRTLSHHQLSAVAFETEEVVFEQDSWLIEKGEPVRALCMILDGHVEVVRPEGKTTVGPGDVVGFPEILVPGPAAFGARARGDVVALRLGTDDLRDLCEHNYAILASLLVYLASGVARNRSALARVVAGGPPATRRDSAPGHSDGVLDRVARMVALYRAPAFPSGSMDALAELAGSMDQITLETGEALWAPGDDADRFCLVCTGSIELWLDGESSLVVEESGVVGLAETLSERRYALGARAREAAVLLTAGVDPFMDVVEDHLEMGFSLLAWLAQRLTEE